MFNCVLMSQPITVLVSYTSVETCNTRTIKHSNKLTVIKGPTDGNNSMPSNIAVSDS